MNLIKTVGKEGMLMFNQFIGGIILGIGFNEIFLVFSSIGFMIFR